MNERTLLYFMEVSNLFCIKYRNKLQIIVMIRNNGLVKSKLFNVWHLIWSICVIHRWQLHLYVTLVSMKEQPLLSGAIYYRP